MITCEVPLGSVNNNEVVFDRRVSLCEMWDDVEEETPAPAEPAPEEAPAAAAETAAAAKPEEAEPPAPENTVLGTEPKKLVFKHWIRWPISHLLYNTFKNQVDIN